jgi:hypothetical protein
MRMVGALLAVLLVACGGDDGDTSLNVTFVFDSGDCAANGVVTVRVTWGPEGGADETVDLVCADGGGALGDTGSGGTFGISAQGLDADGAVVAESYGQTLTVGASGTGGVPIDIHLHPATADVTVTWSLSTGGSCPPGVVLPYFVTLFVAPAEDGGELVDDVAEVQESCQSGQAVLARVAPGDYVVEVDSRAVTPAVRGTAPVTVAPGEDTTVAVDM